jgi:hypothetical protein
VKKKVAPFPAGLQTVVQRIAVAMVDASLCAKGVQETRFSFARAFLGKLPILSGGQIV